MVGLPFLEVCCLDQASGANGTFNLNGGDCSLRKSGLWRQRHIQFNGGSCRHGDSGNLFCKPATVFR